MISNSGSDERGKASGGQAGDQTGGEWRVRTWYPSPWKCVLRYPSEQVRAKIAELATESANNNNIGYNQAKRTTFWKELVKANYQPSRIVTKCDADCSAGVSAICKAVGYVMGIEKLKNISADNWTGSMRVAFKCAGFEVLTDSKYLASDKYLLPGDVLLNDSKHTCINLDYGSEVKPKAKPQKYSGAFPIVPPNLKFGSNGLQVQRLQKYLNWYGNFSLKVDGEFGHLTLKAVEKMQQAIFTDKRECDGIVGPKTIAQMKKVKN